MLADTDHTIIYANKRLQKTLAEGEAEVRKAIPTFDSHKIVGGKLEAFHDNPAQQRNLLDQLTAAHEAQFALGNLKIAS